ncbi:carbohydrate esterase family 5 protein, partial [Mollisia scopiformis]
LKMRLSVWATSLSLFTLTFASPFPVAVSTLQDRDLIERNTPLNEFLTILLDNIPDISGDISDVVGVLTDFEALLADLTGEQTTYNELGSSACAEYTVIFARGTTEPGNVGILVGPPFFEALESAVGSGNLVIQGVNDYSASIAGYIEGGDPTGSAEMATQIESAYSLCPNTKLIASGYSQGGQIIHNAIGELPADVASWISKVVIFGDPETDDGQALPNVDASKVDTYCHVGDDICLNGDLILPPHLTYAENAAAAAAFVVS